MGMKSKMNLLLVQKKLNENASFLRFWFLISFLRSPVIFCFSRSNMLEHCHRNMECRPLETNKKLNVE